MLNKLHYTFYTVLATVLLSFFALKVEAQQGNSFELTWQKGVVVLTSGDTINGEIVLTLPNDLIRVSQTNGTVSAFSAVNVSSLEVQGNENRNGLFSGSRSGSALNFRRFYISLPWNHDKDYSNFKSPAFFVVLQSGKYTLLMRENLEQAYDQNNSVYNSGSRGRRNVIVQKYYLLAPDQNILPLRNPKQDIYRIFSKQQKQIAAYAKENKLSFTDGIELGQIMAYANSLNP
jgi:hypothetical protein